ncbi:hypothetical protein PIB30_035301 [Stylosanthes scabra]|uniref:Reverse transcriptase zinc-binding domain-containing protein n=1 Tax=Stylosanthes scabra TaxID=79078 RepID=A0ABU6ZCP5_9FABA|nr:hypothetical protein [Stylosanthes scabra]
MGVDSVTWAPEKRGCYKVDSGYQIVFQFFHPPIDLLSAQCRQKQIWNLLWDLQCPPKSRVPSVVDTCPRCGELGETVLHSLVTCPFAADVWVHSNLPLIDNPDSTVDFWNWWLYLMIELKKQPRVFEGVAGSVDLVLSSATELISEYHQHHPP